MTEHPKFVLDACTHRMDASMRAFEDDFETLMRDFQKWTVENNITQKQLWYADVFDFDNAKHLAYLTIEDDNIYLTGAPENSTVNPFKRKMGPIKYTKTVLRRTKAVLQYIFFGPGEDAGF